MEMKRVREQLMMEGEEMVANVLKEAKVQSPLMNKCIT
jgi:hypothetical protein